VLDRRSSGVVSLHSLLLAGEAVLWWLLLAWLFHVLPFVSFTTLLPLSAYPIAIAASILIGMGALWRVDGNFAALGWTEAMRLGFRQTSAVACAVFTVAVGFKDPGISRVFLAAFLLSCGMLFVLLNRFQPGWLVRMLFGGGARLRTLILGDAELFPDLRQWLDMREKLGLMPVGVVSYAGSAPPIPGLPVVGEFANLKAAIAATNAGQVLTLSLPRNSDDAEHLAKVCASCGCRLLIHNNLTFQLTYPLRVLSQDGYSFLAFQDEPLEDPLNRALKRILDVLIAVPVVLFLLPTLMIGVWTVQRKQSRGPLFYLQPRSGRGGRTFNIVKFRTMHATLDATARQTSEDDERVYPFGRFLRRTSIDELPQFLNVLTGEMSVVGPRPHYVRHDHLFAHAVNEYRVRFFVKPGITGLAQSRGLRGEMRTADSIHRRLELDLLYIHSWSVWLDISIIARTVRQLVVPPPAAR
jgi:exopolysaccharide biosynthesis polyprenyl glycosylphosphotransferase